MKFKPPESSPTGSAITRTYAFDLVTSRWETGEQHIPAKSEVDVTCCRRSGGEEPETGTEPKAGSGKGLVKISPAGGPDMPSREMETSEDGADSGSMLIRRGIDWRWAFLAYVHDKSRRASQ